MANRVRGKRRWAKCALEKYNPAKKPSSRTLLRRKSAGYVSLLILLLLTTLSGLGMASYLKASVEHRMVRRETQSRQALYVAEGGIEWAKAHLLINPEVRSGSLSMDTGRSEIKIVESSAGYKVTSAGHSGVAFRIIEEILQLDAGKWIVKNYQELHQ